MLQAIVYVTYKKPFTNITLDRSQDPLLHRIGGHLWGSGGKRLNGSVIRWVEVSGTRTAQKRREHHSRMGYMTRY